MTQGNQKNELCEKSQQLLQGPLKHTRAAALALALVPLAAVAAVQADEQPCASAGIVCGTVFYDANNNGVQDGSEGGIENAIVTYTVDGVTSRPDPHRQLRELLLRRPAR